MPHTRSDCPPSRMRPGSDQGREDFLAHRHNSGVKLNQQSTKVLSVSERLVRGTKVRLSPLLTPKQTFCSRPNRVITYPSYRGNGTTCLRATVTIVAACRRSRCSPEFLPGGHGIDRGQRCPDTPDKVDMWHIARQMDRATNQVGGSSTGFPAL
jgi:hypothetical protein